MTKSPFFVYILPIILSISLGTLVMAEALNDPERELNMWQSDGVTSQQQEQLSIIGLEKTYSTSDQIEFKIQVSDSNFECGDLYITISDGDQVITQSGFMKQCFTQQNQNIPLGDKYSEIIREPGKYKILIEIFDQNYKDSLSYVANITIK
jgi:hypothetical protein|tara:strand:+ start:66 stop:518 length:453 start_codon:yes stop_codon:yes gene_type:complete